MKRKPAAPPRGDFIRGITGEVRYGKRAWDAIRPHVTRYVLADGIELYDEHEVRAFIENSARAEPPEAT